MNVMRVNFDLRHYNAHERVTWSDGVL